MKVVASTDEYTIYLRRDGRHAVKGADKAPVNGDDKVRILLEHGFIEAPTPKAPEPEAEPEAAAAEGEAAEGDEASAEEEAPAEEESAPAEEAAEEEEPKE